MLSAVVPPPSQTADVRREQLCSRLIAFAEHWFDIPRGSITNPKRRNGKISKARWAVAYVLNKEAGWSQPKIAKHYGCNNSSIHNAWKQAAKLLREDRVFFEAVERLKKEISPA